MISRLPDMARLLRAVYEPEEARALARWIVDEVMDGRLPAERVDEVLTRLLRSEPIQYILGYTSWGDMCLHVSPATLIPRPETLSLCQHVARLYPEAESRHVLDIGTGSGCIALGVKRLRPLWQVSGVDLSVEALSVARRNAEANGLEVTFAELDILDSAKTDRFIGTIGRPVGGDFPYDIVVSNPPYICQSERAAMADNVLLYEPETALFVPDDDPLLFYRRIAMLRWGAWLAFEINERFGHETADMLRSLQYTDIQILIDDYDKPRFVLGRCHR